MFFFKKYLENCFEVFAEKIKYLTILLLKGHSKVMAGKG